MNRLLLAVVSVLLVVSAVAPATAATATAATDNSVTGCEFPFSEVDATGTEVTVTQSADRIVTLAPSAAQTVWEIDGADQVVGVTEYASYLDGAGEKTTVGAYQIDVETVVSLNPDIVLAPNTVPDKTVSKLRSAGLTVYKFRAATSIDFIAEKTLLTGKLIGNCQAAQERTETFRTQVETISDAVAGVTRPDVVHILGKTGYAAGSGTFINKIIQRSGGTNIAAGKFSGYQQISAETVIAENPQWITRPRVFDLSEYAGTTAVDENQTITLNENYISQPAPRIVIPMLELVQTWHPEAYREASLSQIDVGSLDDSKIGPTTYSHTILDDESVRLDVSLNYFENKSARFPVPETFENESNPRLTEIQVTPRESNWNFGVTVTKLQNNVTLGNSAEPLAGYRITPHGMWPDALKAMSVSAKLNTTQSTANISADEITAYTNQSGNWTATPVSTNTTNETIRMQVSTSAYTSIYFATNTTGATSESTVDLTRTTSTEPTATTTSTATPTTSTTTDTVTATEPTASPTSAQQTTPNTTGTTIPGFGLLTTMLSCLLVSVGLYGRYRFTE